MNNDRTRACAPRSVHPKSASWRVAVTCSVLALAVACLDDGVGEIPSDATELKDAIFHSVKYDNTKRIQALVDAGAPTNQPDLLGWTPLHYAVNRLHNPDFDEPELISVIASGPDTNLDAQDNSGLRPIDLATKFGSIEVLEILTKNGASLDLIDNEGLTLLMTAVKHQQVEMAEYLIKMGSDPNEQLPAGGTALFLAVRSRTPAMVALLLEHGADVHGNERADDPIIFAAALNNEDVIKLLVDAGANVNAVNRNNGYTPLHRAVASGPTMIELLLKLGARPSVSDQQGETALDLATKLGHEESIRLLSEAS